MFPRECFPLRIKCSLQCSQLTVSPTQSPHQQTSDPTNYFHTTTERAIHATYSPIMTGEQSLASDQNQQQQQKLPSYVSISCVISGYGRGEKTRTTSSPVTSPVRFECPPLPTAKDRHPHLFAPETEEEKKKSLVQKKIESLYGRTAGEQWSKSKPTKKHDNIQSTKGASVPQAGTQNSQQAFDAVGSANGTPKKGMTKFSYPSFDALLMCVSIPHPHLISV